MIIKYMKLPLAGGHELNLYTTPSVLYRVQPVETCFLAGHWSYPSLLGYHRWNNVLLHNRWSADFLQLTTAGLDAHVAVTIGTVS